MQTGAPTRTATPRQAPARARRVVRAGRVVRLALVLALGTGLVAGCQPLPGAAAVVGDVRITDAQVDATVDHIDADLRAGRRPEGLPAEAYGDLRQTVVQLTVFIEVAKRYAAEKGYSAPSPDYVGWAQQFGLPESDPFIRLVADSNAYRELLLAKTEPTAPTEEDLRDVFVRIRRAVQNAGTFEQLRPQIEQHDPVRRGVSLRNQLAEATRRYGVQVSPRYQPIELPIATAANPSGGEIVLVALPLLSTPNVVDDNDVVRDSDAV